MNIAIETANKNTPLDDLSKQFAVLQAANHIAHLLGKTNPLEQAIEPLINEFIELVQADCGSNQSRKVDVRIIAAASIDLNQKIAKGEFRSDLFFRLNVVSIKLPALRERVEDIPTLVANYLKRFAGKHGKQLRHLAADAIKILERYAWPGNVRELENVIERAVILAKPILVKG